MPEDVDVAIGMSHINIPLLFVLVIDSNEILKMLWSTRRIIMKAAS